MRPEERRPTASEQRQQLHRQGRTAPLKVPTSAVSPNPAMLAAYLDKLEKASSTPENAEEDVPVDAGGLSPEQEAPAVPEPQPAASPVRRPQSGRPPSSIGGRSLPTPAKAKARPAERSGFRQPHGKSPAQPTQRAAGRKQETDKNHCSRQKRSLAARGLERFRQLSAAAARANVGSGAPAASPMQNGMTQAALQLAGGKVKRVLWSLALPLLPGFLVVAGVALLIFGLFSPQGVLLTDAGDTNSLRAAVLEVQAEYQTALDQITSRPHDALISTGAPPDWRNVLSIYAVRVSGSIEEDGGELLAEGMTDEKKALLREVFWDMNEISWFEEQEEQEEQEEPETAAAASAASVETQPPKITLTVTLLTTQPEQAAARYGFSEDQLAMLSELLDAESGSLWAEVLLGVPVGGIPGGDWVYPLPTEAEVTSPFGMRYHPVEHQWKLHEGVDLAIELGTPIYAVRAGTVTTASYNDSAGNHVVIDHGEGYASVYMHQLFFVVQPGQEVLAGQVIGYVGSTGASTGPHLHLAISQNGVYMDPLLIVQYHPPEAETTAPPETEAETTLPPETEAA